MEAYNSGDDVHALTARLLLDKSKVSDEERRLGKTINFGVIYGMGAQRFARATGVSQAEAKEFLSRYKQRYPKVFAFLEWQERLALSRGYVETLMGRRRPFHFDPQGLGRLKGTDPAEIDLDVARRGGMEAQQLVGSRQCLDSRLQRRHHQKSNGGSAAVAARAATARPATAAGA